jgi:hypothetical protein
LEGKTSALPLVHSAGQEEDALVEAEQHGADADVGGEVAAALADAEAEAHADAAPDRDDEHRAGVARLQGMPVTWAMPMTATQRPTAITVAAVISLKEGLRSSMPKKVMTG